MQFGDLLDDRFELEKLASSGGMGRVYRARDRRGGEPVAVKLLLGQERDDAARFAREARILAELEHPNIVRHIAHGLTSSGEPWIAMEWLEGKDLACRLEEGPLGVVETVTLALAIAEALGFAHERGVVHRDIKPSNVFLEGGDPSRAKLLDFGIAYATRATRITQGGMLMGTLGYMAPEQASGAAQVDARADVFSLGCVIFECLSGERAFFGTHAVAILTKILLEQPPQLSEKMNGIAPALDALVTCMLQKNAAARPADGRAIVTALRSLGELSTQSATARATPATPATPATLERPARALRGGEQRAIAVLLIGAPQAEGTGEPGMDATVRLDEDLDFAAIAARHGGHYERLLDGSAAILLSGSTLATDLAARAARCALSLRVHAAGRPIALAMGRGELMGLGSVGEAIDRAATLTSPEDAASAMVRLDDVVAGLLDARFDVREEESGIYLLGERELGDSVRTLLGKPTPCVGRERELRILEKLFDDCIEADEAQPVLVTAPAGMGKSRLAQELLHHVRAQPEPVAVWVGRGDPLREGAAFGLLGQALRGACGVREGEPLALRRDKILARVTELVPEAETKRVAEFLGELVGTPFPDEESPSLRAARQNAQLMREQMRSAFVTFVSMACSAHPVFVLLEDLHWGDRPTVQFIDAALRELKEMPLFVLALARPEVNELFPKLWFARGIQELHLKELGKKAVERLMRHALGDKATSQMVDRFLRLSEGNALYLEELIRWAAEERSGELPETVVAMVQSRLFAQDDESRKILRAASVFGELFWQNGVSDLLGGAEPSVSLGETLARLVERELVTRRKASRFPGEDEYIFRHALVREGAYAMLTSEDRALGHALAGEWLERHGEEDSIVLAEHFEKGGDGVRAARHYYAAAVRANMAGDSSRAIECIERGLSCPLPKDERNRLLGMFCVLHVYRINRVGSVLPRARELLRIAERGSLLWAQALVVILVGARRTGAHDEYAAALRQLMEGEIQPEAVDSISIALGNSVCIADLSGDMRLGDTIFERMVAVTRPFDEIATSAGLFCDLIASVRDVYAHGRPFGALLLARRVKARAHTIGHWRLIACAQMLISGAAFALGAYDEVIRSVEENERSDDEFGAGLCLRPFALAIIFAERGAFDEARVWTEQLVAIGQRREAPLDEARGHWALAEVLRRAGDFDAAEAEISVALAILETACPLDLPGVLATLSALRLAQGRISDALSAAEEGLAKYRTMGGCGLFRGASLRLVHAECLDAAGRKDEAQAAIAEARQSLLATAEEITDPEYRKSFLENVPENRRTLELARAWLGEDTER